MAYTATAVAPVEGVTLEQYAGVSAAIIEGFPLPTVLESEGLDARAWPRASLGWSQRLAKDGAGGPLATAYRDTLAFARGWLGRRVAPLDDDLGAWMAFLNAWSAHPAPFDLLAQMDISPSDVTRIQGAWAQRLEKDEALQKQALDLAKKKRSAVPKVTVTRADLKPFPWSKKRKTETEEPVLVKPKLSSSFIGDAFGLERYAALHAELGQAKKGGAAAVLARQALDEAGFAALEARWQRRFAADSTLAQDFRRLVRYYEAKLKTGSKQVLASETPRLDPAPVMTSVATGALAEPSARPANALVGTALAVNVPRGPALPFVEAAPVSVLITESPPAEVKSERPAAQLGGTSLAVEVPARPALPFEGPKGPAKEVQAKLAGTALAVHVPVEPELPFVESAPAVIPAPPAKESKAERPAAKFGGTALTVDAPRGPVLPFGGAEEVGPPPSRNKFARMSLDISAARDQGLAEQASAGGTGQVPALTLEQHASMTVEIAMAPEKATGVLARYGLTAEGKREVDGYWRKRVMANAGERDAWEKAYRAYWEWLTANRSGA